MISSTELNLAKSISAQEMYRHIREIDKFGVRMAGSKAVEQAVEYFANHCTECGLNTILEEFYALCFEPIEFSLSVNEPISKKIDCHPMIFSPSSADGEITADMVFVGNGRDEDYNNKDVKNKFVLLERDSKIETDFFYQEVCLASRKGAIGVIMMNYQPWPFIGTLESGFFDPEKRVLPIEPKPIPAVCISSTDGNILKWVATHSKKPVKVSLLVKTVIENRLNHNVRSILPGSTFPEERIIISGHIDTEGTRGGNDNSSGLSIMLELARVFSNYKPARSIEFLATGCEEVVSIGSWEYCKRNSDTLGNIIAVLNIDMVGVGSDLHLITEGKWPEKTIRTPEWLYSFVAKVANSLNYRIQFDVCELGTSDEGRFLDAGVPAIFFWKPGDDHYHSPLDVPEYVDSNGLKVVAEIAGLSAWKLANR